MADYPDEGILIRHQCDCDSCVSRGGGNYFFLGPDAPTFKLQVLIREQKGRQVMVGMEEARLIDLCSYVPSIDEKEDYDDQAEKLWGKSDDQWQRTLDRDRQEKIGKFWSLVPKEENDSHGHIVNNVVLSYSQANDLSIDKENSELNLGGWFADVCSHCNATVLTTLNHLGEEESAGIMDELSKAEDSNLYAELCPNRECNGHKGASGINHQGRPFEIIDGQHRTRGLNHADNAKWENSDSFGKCINNVHPKIEDCEADDSCEWQTLLSPTREPIPFSITVFQTTEPEKAAKARLFVDINTRAEDLSPNHKITMLWRHRVPDGKINDPVWKDLDNLDFSSNDKLEYRIYTLILEMIRQGSNLSQTKGMIPPLATKSWDNNNNQTSVRNMRDYLTKWMNTGRVFSGYTSATSAPNYARVFNNYLSAWAWWLSGPVPDDANVVDDFKKVTDKRYWAPSHKDYATRNPIFDHKDTPGSAKTIVTSPKNGFIQHLDNVGPNDGEGSLAKKGEVDMSPAYRLIYELFEPITVSILIDKYEQENDDLETNPWQQSHLNSLYSPATKKITELEYRQEVQKFIMDGDDWNYEFGRDGLSQGEINKGKPDELAKILCLQLGWKWRA